MEFDLRCFVQHDREGYWLAFCNDLCLVAQADTYAEAVGKLDSLIDDYLDWAVSEHQMPRQQVLRRAPRDFYFRYWIARLRELLHPDRVRPRVFRRRAVVAARAA